MRTWGVTIPMRIASMAFACVPFVRRPRGSALGASVGGTPFVPTLFVRHGAQRKERAAGVVRIQVTREAGLALVGRMMAPSRFQRWCEYGPRCWRSGEAARE